MSLTCPSCGGPSDWGFEWSVGGGIQLAIDKGTAGVQYRYISASIENVDFGQHSLSVEFGFVSLPDLVR
jgi:opacity protein-like surface antigen